MEMRDLMTLVENVTTPLIVVDVQPEYDNSIVFTPKLMQFINSYQGPVLMLVNAEETGVSSDTKSDIAYYWIENGLKEDKLDELQIFDKGYGHLRSWMDNGVSEDAIIAVIRFMIQHRLHDSRDITETTGVALADIMGDEYDESCEYEMLSIGWIDFNLLRRLRGALLCGGGRHECLAEVRIMLEALEVPYNTLEQFIYG